MNILETVPMIGMSIEQALDEIVPMWGDDLLVICGNTNQQDHNGIKPLTTVTYDSGDGHELYTLYLNGDVYRVTSKDIENGYTWNGDDQYYKSFSTVYTVHEKVGSIEISSKLDYTMNEAVENLACQFIECLREI